MSNAAASDTLDHLNAVQDAVGVTGKLPRAAVGVAFVDALLQADLDRDAAAQASDMAYCDTAFEHFDGDFAAFQRARRAEAVAADQIFADRLLDVAHDDYALADLKLRGHNGLLQQAVATKAHMDARARAAGV